jgi:hypothetical protein
MPLATKIVERLKEMFSNPRVQAGIKLLIDKIGAFATVIGKMFDKLMSGDIKGALSEIIPAETVDKIMAFAKSFKELITETIIPFVQKHAKGIKAAIIGIGAVLAAAGIVSLITAIANPLGLIIAAVGLLAAAWTEDWGGIRTALQTVWDWVKTYVFPIIKEFIEVRIAALITSIQILANFWTSTLQPALATFWGWVQTTVFPIIQSLWDWLSTNIPAAIQTLSDFWTNTLLPAINNVWDFISTYILPIFQDVIDIATKLGEIALTALAGFWEKTLQPALETVWGYFNDNIMPIFTAVRDFIRDELGPKIQWLSDSVFTPLADTLEGGVKRALTWLHDQLVKIKDFLDNFTLPGWLTPGSPTPFEVGLRGIADAMDELNSKTARVNFVPGQLKQAGGYASSPINITIQGSPKNEMDMRRLARYVATEIQRSQL